MNRFVARGALVVTAVVATLLTGVQGADAATPAWLHVHTVRSATAYNGGRARIVALVGVGGTRVVTSRRLTVYRNGHRYRSGSSVRLFPGHYKSITSGTYRSYVNVRVRKTRRVLHSGDYEFASCVVATGDDANGRSVSFCTDAYYPGERPQYVEYYADRTPGERHTELVWFNGEYITQTYYVTQRRYGATHHLHGSKRSLTVRNGGYRHVYASYGNYQTTTFHPPKSTWRLSYSFDCQDYANFAVWVYRSNGEMIDLAANDLGYANSHTTYEHASGHFFLEVDADSDCNWRITVRA
jgi:hypothetical protein